MNTAGTMRRRGVGRLVPVSCLGVPRCTLLSQVSLYMSVRVDWGMLTCFVELLVDVVDVVLEGSGIDEKFLGVTLFALVPNTTEFMNAISFAMNGNISLRWDFYRALCAADADRSQSVWRSGQRTPCRFVFSRSRPWLRSLHGMPPGKWGLLLTRSRTSSCDVISGLLLSILYYSLIFPRWDVIVIILSVFLLTYCYIEAKSNYHRGSILILR